jgi:hypothetical protein
MCQRNWAYDYELKDAEIFTKLLVDDICEWIEGVPESEEGMILLSKSFMIASIKGYFGVK